MIVRHFCDSVNSSWPTDLYVRLSLSIRFRATLYPCPETPQERKEMLAGVNARIDDLQMVSRREKSFAVLTQ